MIYMPKRELKTIQKGIEAYKKIKENLKKTARGDLQLWEKRIRRSIA